MMHLRPLCNRGDTIIEVLIAMTVASFILGGAYALTSHSLANSRQAQEHTEALQIANNKIEAIRSIHSTNPIAFETLTQQTRSCIDDSGTVTLAAPGCPTEGTIQYEPLITYTGTSSTNVNGYFTINVVWPSVTGRGNDTVSQLYRIHQ